MEIQFWIEMCNYLSHNKITKDELPVFLLAGVNHPCFIH